MKLYGALPAAGIWDYGRRHVWTRIRAIIEKCPARSVIDVGCFRGDFLTWLGDSWRRFGIEPSAAARAEAEARGIALLGERIETLDGGDLRVGAVTMIDVLEHIPRPLDALRRAAGLLLPGGKLVIFTGSTDALSWRLGGRFYWYCGLPEHVAFFSPGWFRWAAPQLGCEVLGVERLPHTAASLHVRIDEALKNALYLGYRRLAEIRTLRRLLDNMPLLGRVGRWRMAWWTSAPDHALVALGRSPSASLDR